MSPPEPETGVRPQSPWRRFEGGVAGCEKVVVVLAMSVMFLAGVAQVFIRLAGWRSAGTDEIVTTSMAILIFVGAGLVVYTADHIAIEVLQYLPSLRLRRGLRAVGLVSLAGFAVVFGYYAYGFVGNIAGERTLTLGIPLVVSAGSMVVGAALILLHTLGAIARLATGDDVEDEQPLTIIEPTGSRS